MKPQRNKKDQNGRHSMVLNSDQQGPVEQQMGGPKAVFQPPKSDEKTKYFGLFVNTKPIQ